MLEHDVDSAAPPLMSDKAFDAPSVFTPESLLREGLRHRKRSATAVPATCVLDPDGDIVRALAGHAVVHPGWGCFHTELWVAEIGGVEVGFIGSAVGAPFAVLVAEQLAASGAELVISVVSAGRIGAPLEGDPFVLIERALRDEGTSAHYLPPGRWSHLDDKVARAVLRSPAGAGRALVPGTSWTTDAPYRETADAVEAAASLGAVCVEMEAAGLYAYAAARGRRVVCIAHITNTMATDLGDFDKGDDHGVAEVLALVTRIRRAILTER